MSGAVSSQYLTALLMAAPLALEDIRITITDTLVSTPYVEMTIKLMQRFGVTVHHAEDFSSFHIPSQQTYKASARACSCDEREFGPAGHLGASLSSGRRSRRTALCCQNSGARMMLGPKIPWLTSGIPGRTQALNPACGLGSFPDPPSFVVRSRIC